MFEIDADYVHEWKVAGMYLADIEVNVIGHFSIDGNAGDPEIQVANLIVDGIDMMRSDSPTVKLLAIDIVEAIQSNVGWITKQARMLGYVYRGKGANDPDGHWSLCI
jgi:hypothetical protein